MTTHFIDDRDLDRATRLRLLETCWAIKHEGRDLGKPLDGKSVAVVMSKPSLRTRVSFAVAIHGLGGHVVEVNAQNTKLGAGEEIEEWAAVLGSMVDCIVARVHGHELLLQFEQHGGVPIINALSDLLHPCQAVADAFTVWEHARKSGAANSGNAEEYYSQPRRWAWLGDGNNVTHSLMLAAASLGVTFVSACPSDRQPDPAIVKAARELHPAGADGIITTDDPNLAASGAEMLYADTWVSYGQEGQMTKEQVEKTFAPYRIDEARMKQAADGAIFMHCLPAQPPNEVTYEVLRGSQSVILPQAENRLWSSRAILADFVFA